MSEDRFVHFHTHSDRSHLDGCGKLEDYVKVAKKRGHRAIAFTEHGTMRGIYDLVVAAGDGIKPIFGIEAYVCEDMNRRGLTEEERAEITERVGKKDAKEAITQREQELGIRKRWHLSVWAKDQTGLQNLFKLSSKAWIDGFYYKPRIDLKTLYEHREGLVIGTGCVNAPVPDLWLQGRKKEALDLAHQLHDHFGSDMFLEVMPHCLSDGVQHEVNELMVELRSGFPDCRLLATQDSHYIHPEDAEHHEVLLCIGTGAVMRDPDRFKFDACGGFHFRTREEMEAAFRSGGLLPEHLIQEACDTTLNLADQISAKITIDPFKCLLPPIDLPEAYRGHTFAYLRDLCLAGWEWREINDRADRQAAREGVSPERMLKRYTQRLKYELKMIRDKGFDPYFLIVRDIYEWSRSKGIRPGPGRGSSAGSIVAFLLGITAIDPIEHGLLFERFISPARVDMPDIDMDFEDVRRGEIIEYLRQKYGHDRVAQIATIGRLSGKAVVKDVARVFDVPFNESNAVTSEIIERSMGDERVHKCVIDSFEASKLLQDFDKRYPMVLHHAQHLEGMAKTPGIHAAGVVTSPVPLWEVVPLETRKQSEEGDGEKVIVTAIDMIGVKNAGLLKLDVLGLKNLSIFTEALKEIKDHYGADVDLERLPLDAPEILQAFTEHDYIGVFQYDSPSSHRVCDDVEFTTFEDVAVMTALNRPGTSRSGLTELYKARKKKKDKGVKHHFHPKITEITKDTLGVLVYQEHVVRIAVEVAGYSAVEADKLRKTIGMRLGEEILAKETDKFVAGCRKHTPDMPRETAEKLMAAIAKFGAYSFNKSHATCYGLLAYWDMWLKRKYPLEFYVALLRHERDMVNLRRIARDAEKRGVKILQPDVNISKDSFTIDRSANGVRGSLRHIKQVGEKAAAAIMAAQPFKDIEDFVKRVPRKSVTKRAVESLTAAGAMNALVPNPRYFWAALEDLWALAENRDTKAGARKMELFKDKIAKSSDPRMNLFWTPEEAEEKAAEVNPFAIHAHPCDSALEWCAEHIKGLGGTIYGFDDPDLWSQKWCWVLGAIVDVKDREVGQYDDRKLSVADRKRLGYGEPYAMAFLEDASTEIVKTKVDQHIYPVFSTLLYEAKRSPRPVLALVEPSREYRMLNAHFLVDLNGLRDRLASGGELNVWERIAIGRHPALTYPWKSEADRRDAGATWKSSARTWRAIAVVAHVRERLDKKKQRMAFFTLVGPKNVVQAMCFGSSWPVFRDYVKPGELLALRLETMRDGAIALDANTGGLKVLRRKGT